MRREGDGGGSLGSKSFLCQKWLNQIFPMVNFAFSHDGHFGLGERGGSSYGYQTFQYVRGQASPLASTAKGLTPWHQHKNPPDGSQPG